jgi:very-short-patch-repair endonuclease
MKEPTPTPTPTPPALPLSGEESAPSPDGTTSHSTRLSKNDSQVAGYDKGRAGEGFDFLRYNKKLTALARANRMNPTAAEKKMWSEILRMRQFARYKFLRQKPIAEFIVDFYCSELRLVIEIDGDSHGETVEYDFARTNALNAHGLTVVRYTNEDVLKNIAGVYDDLAQRLSQDVLA